MAWFRRDSDAAVAPKGGGSSGGVASSGASAGGRANPLADDDSPAVLRSSAVQLGRFVNASAGSLPTSAVVAARQVTDVLREIVDTSEVRELDVYALVTVKGMLNDYLPTTLRTYLALDPASVERPAPSGLTPTASLNEQLEALLDGAYEVLDAVRSQDADALMAQGRFLQAKFTGSDLDL